jgi:hypothetical protein
MCFKAGKKQGLELACSSDLIPQHQKREREREERKGRKKKKGRERWREGEREKETKERGREGGGKERRGGREGGREERKERRNHGTIEQVVTVGKLTLYFLQGTEMLKNFQMWRVEKYHLRYVLI